MRSYDVLIDGEPYIFEKEGITLGNTLLEPGAPRQIGSAVIEDVITGLGPAVNRGNGYYDIHRLIPTVEGQLIFAPTATAGPERNLNGFSSDYTPGIHHHPFTSAGGQYIAFGKYIYAIFLSDIATLSYTQVDASDASTIGNAFARYTGGAFVWRNKMYFGIENSLNGQALGYAWVDAAFPTDSVVVADLVKGFSYAASGRGRLFIAQNQAVPPGTDGIPLKWSSDMAHDYSDALFTLYGTTGTFVYAIENRPRVTWVGMQGSAVLFFLADGSVLASDEAGFIGIISGRSQSSAAEDNFQGFGAVPFLDGMAFPVNFGGPHHINPVTLLTKSLSVGNVQDVPLDVHDIRINCMTSVGEHLLMAGDRYLYDLVWSRQAPVVHKICDLWQVGTDYGVSNPNSYIASAMTYQGGLLVITMLDRADFRIRQIQMEITPALNRSVATYNAGPLMGWIRPGVLIGSDRAQSMTKLWLQIRGANFASRSSGATISFDQVHVDESAFNIPVADVVGTGPWSARISQSAQPIGRTLSFRMKLNTPQYTGFSERIYTPIVADFVWAPDAEDMVTLTLRASAEQLSRVGGALVRRSARDTADALLSKLHQFITVQFSDGSPENTTGSSAGALWDMFVEEVEAKRGVEADSGYGSDSYVVTLACRRL